MSGVDRMADIRRKLYAKTCPGCCNCEPSNFNDPTCNGDGAPVEVVPLTTHRGAVEERDKLLGLLEEAAPFVPYGMAEALKVRIHEALPLPDGC